MLTDGGDARSKAIYGPVKGLTDEPISRALRLVHLAVDDLPGFVGTALLDVVAL